jgi:hypothetical protein
MKLLKIVIVFTITPFFVSAILKAQTINTISGMVVNTNHDSLMGNVFLLSVPDSTFIKGVTFINGVFELSGINQKEVFLKLTSLEFTDTLLKLQYNGQQHINLGAILVKQNKFQLNEVTVTGRLPLVRYAPNGNIEVNVANTVLATSSSVNEILTKSPNLIENEGRYAVIGKGDAIIYLNGKQISSERMSTIPISQITKIEIISNPSSKYDAEGKAVINIITKMKAEEGIMGTISQHVTVSAFGGINANSLLDLTYTKGKLTFVGNYGLLAGKNREELYTTRTRLIPNEYFNSDLTTNWREKFNNFSNYGLGAQYNINERSYISLAYNGSFESQGGSTESKNSIDINNVINLYKSDIAVKEIRLNHSVILNYNKIIDTLGSAFFIGSQYSYYNSDIDDFIEENSIVDGVNTVRLLKNKVGHNIYISSTQADYTKVFNARQKLEVGAKFSYVYTTSGTTFLISEKGMDFELSEQLSSNFKYDEKVPAAYLNYSVALGARTNFQAGVRGEWTNYELNTTVNGTARASNSYFNLFPNLSINNTVSDNFKLRFSYTARIGRPPYQALNPFGVYQDPFTTIEGNPNLVPDKSHAFEVGTLYKYFDFKIGYTYTLDPFTAAALRGATPSSYVLKRINLDKDHTFFTALSRTVEFKGWTSVNTVNVNYEKMIDNKYSYVLVESRPQIYFYSNNTFNVNNLFKIQLLAWYVGERYYGLRHERERSTITLGIEKSFFANSLQCSITANDIFHNDIYSGNYEVGQTAVYYHRTLNTSYFKFIVACNFGKLKKTNYKNKETGQPENNRAN